VAISDKTRKLLWGRAGGICAICDRPLTAAPTADDPAAVLGEECHIVARSVGGPRFAPLPPEKVDACENVILLCAHDHRRVDDQPGHYTTAWLRGKKAEHERRVAALGRAGVPDARFLDDPRHRSVRLSLITTGGELWPYITGGFESVFDQPDPEDEAEVGLLADFVQNLADFSDIHDDLPQGDHIRIKFELTQQLRELSEAGFAVYAGNTQRIFEMNGQRIPWPGKIFRIVRLEASDRLRAGVVPAAQAPSLRDSA